MSQEYVPAFQHVALAALEQLKGNSDGDIGIVDGEMVVENSRFHSDSDANPHEMRVFDALSADLFQCPLIQHAVRAWRMWPKTIYSIAAHPTKGLHPDRIRGEIHDVRRMKGIKDPGKYLHHRLKNMMDGKVQTFC